jgi:hypothetical protein
MKIQLFSNEVDWGHVILSVLLVIAVVSRFRTSHHKKFSISFTLRREKDDVTSTEDKNDMGSQHDSDEGDEIIPP